MSDPITDVIDLSDFKQASGRLRRLIDDWDEVKKETDYNRELRYINIDTENERLCGRLKMDETYVPARIIDTNIRREQPQYVAYIMQPKRSIVFEPVSDYVRSTDGLERQFTSWARYESWETPMLQVVDGAETHGWDFVEVVFDPEKPGNFAVEHVGRSDLIFDKDTEDIQKQEIVIKRERYSLMQLKDPKNGFDLEQVRQLVSGVAENLRDQLFEIFKCFYKKDGVVYYGYFGGCHTSDWLFAPRPHYMGIRDHTAMMIPVDEEGTMDYPEEVETTYPFHKLTYYISENHKVTAVKGRANLDEYSQEAASGIQSGLVNGAMRATNVYGSFDNAAADSAAPKQTDIVLKHGAIYDKGIKFHSTPYPDTSIVQAFQAMVGQNQQEQSQVNYATQNRKDSRKTAAEIYAAREEASKLSGVQVLMLSMFMRSVYGQCWRICRSRVLQRKISVREDIFPLFLFEYNLKSSGDVDIIARQEKEAKQRQDWPVFSTTALAMEFLKDIIATSYPDESAKYLKILEQGEEELQLILGMAQVIQQLVTDENGSLLPQYKALQPQLAALAQRVQQYVQQRQGTVQASSVAPADRNAGSPPQTRALAYGTTG